MPALTTFYGDQAERLQRMVSNALDGCACVASRPDGGDKFLITGRRIAGGEVHVRFLGVADASQLRPLPVGERLKLKDVKSVGKPWNFLLPGFLRPAPAWRVTIGAGESEFELVCEDVEWWED